MKYKVFLSYARADYANAKGNLVSDVKALLESYGSDRVELFFDQDGIESGDLFVEKIPEAISESHIFIAILTEKSCNSPWVFRELFDALEKGVRVIPIKAIEAYPSKINFLLSTVEYIDHITAPSGTISKLKSKVDKIFAELDADADKNSEIYRLEAERNAIVATIRSYEEYVALLKGEIEERQRGIEALKAELEMRKTSMELIAAEISVKSNKLRIVEGAIEELAQTGNSGSKPKEAVSEPPIPNAPEADGSAPAEVVVPAREDKQEPATTEEATPAPVSAPASESTPTSTPASEESTPAESPAPAPAAAESKSESPQKAMSALMAHMKFLKPTPKEEAPKSEGGAE